MTVVPVSVIARKPDTSCDVTFSARAFFWSSSKRTERSAGSSQSNCTFTVRASPRTVAATFSAMARTVAMSSPLTRNCTG